MLSILIVLSLTMLVPLSKNTNGARVPVGAVQPQQRKLLGWMAQRRLHQVVASASAAASAQVGANLDHKVHIEQSQQHQQHVHHAIVIVRCTESNPTGITLQAAIFF
jgi:hypothetical protein